MKSRAVISRIKEETRATLASIKQAFTFLMPVFMVGAFSLTAKFFPITAVSDFFERALGGKIMEVFDLLYKATYEFAALYLVIVLSYYESRRRTEHEDTRIFAVVSATACYFAFMGQDVLSGKVDFLQYTKMTNVFSAFLISLGWTWLFFKFDDVFFKNSRLKSSTAFERAMRGILPFICCLIVSVAAVVLLGLIPGVSNFNDLTILLLNKPFESMGSSFLSGLLVMLSISVLWLLGIHGSNVFDNLLTDSEVFALTASNPLSKRFIDTFVLMGGCGTSICLLVALLIFAKSRQNKRIGKVSAIPALFNINETLIFGLPISLNPVYAIPFVLTPLVSYTIAYLATMSGIVPQVLASADIPWTTPIILSGYQATGSIAGSILQVILLAIGVAIYAPFVRLSEKIAEKNMSRNVERLTNICKDCETLREKYHLENPDVALIALEDFIASKLEKDIRNEKIELYYQPQVRNGLTVSAEALLRFSLDEGENNKVKKFLYPPLVVGIANNYNMFDDLSRLIVKKAMKTLSYVQKNIDPNFKISVNLSLELLANVEFKNWLTEQLLSSGLKYHSFGIEITEEANVSKIENCTEIFNQLKNAGAEMYMDDFSMGNTSITILQQSLFDFIKLDGNLTRALENERSHSIVSSVVSLGKQLNFSIIAEYVETKEQRDILLDVGCDIFQGYLYYKPMPELDFEHILESERA